jgi:protein gp37
VFINSLSDPFEDWQGPVYRLEDGNPVVVAQSLDDVRQRFFRVAGECTELDILLLTKRPENVYNMLPNSWRCNWRPWVWLGATVEDVARKQRADELRKIPASVRFLSIEPLLEDLGELDLTGIHWVIVGGESGKNARPMNPTWVHTIRDQCVAAGVPFFFKQWGEWVSVLDRDKDDPDWRYDYAITDRDREHYRILNLAGGQGFHGDRVHVMRKVGKKNAGRVLDGRTWEEVPNE